MGATGARLTILTGAIALLAACAPAAPPVTPLSRDGSALEQALHAHVDMLASDAFAGREAGTIGEDLTLTYLEEAFGAAGLRSGTLDPGNPWREPVSYSRNGRTLDTYNFIARLPGSEPQAGAVLVMAHWDHLGYGSRCRANGDDRICNGAVDNASGLAMLIEIARTLAQGPQLDRDVYFLATGGEEDGLRGASAFVSDPPVPLENFVAAFNLDTEGIAPAGAPAVVLATPDPATTDKLMRIISGTAHEQGVELVPPDGRNRKFLRRQDGWVFDAEGIPAVLISTAFAQKERLSSYMRGRYHRADDEAAFVELGGAADMVRFHAALVTRVADPARMPRATLTPAGGG
ncbi:M28 family peptidase [Croceicoccus bisphenolivorans]|uniref:M28 family peptidase n=1 Tax=Croceicoccus bisphenolivorans TaxID=1783232 RepID=UPI00083083A9|nr:M28 family peptidase [Croceicoccus bisphenolivorans]